MESAVNAKWKWRKTIFHGESFLEVASKEDEKV